MLLTIRPHVPLLIMHPAGAASATLPTKIVPAAPIRNEANMELVRRRFLCLAAALAVAPVVPRFAWPQGYPTKPVRLIVPVAPGGPTDVFARLIAQRLSENFGKQFYVDNVSGAGGNIGIGRAAREAPDGYTILVTPNSYVLNPTLYGKVPYDPYKDFDPITVAVTNVVVLVVNASLPARTVKDLVAVIKTTSGKYSYASAGIGQPSHLVGELFRLSLGLDLVHVPFNGSGPAVGSAVAGHTPIAFVSATTAGPHVAEGKLRALAVMNKARLQALPDVPTMAEAGYAAIECDSWLGLLAPAGTPGEIIALLHHQIVEIISLPVIRERMAVLGFEPVVNSPQDFAEQIRAEIPKWAKVIRAAGISAQ